MLKTYNIKLKFIGVFLLSVLAFLSFGTDAHAASITVSTDTNPSPCTLDEAIENINDQAQTNSDCVEAGVYGTDDTITIPEGTVLLTADLVAITEPVIIEGAGMSETVIDGDAQYKGLLHNGDTDFTVKKIKIQRFEDYAVNSGNGNLTIDQLEVDGSGAVFTGNPMVLFLQHNTGSSRSFNITNTHIHDINTSNANLQVLVLVTKGSATNTAYVENVTISNISNTGSLSAVAIGTGFAEIATGGMNGTIRNTTVTNINSSSSAAVAFSAMTFGINNTTQLELENVTVTDISGVDSFLGYSAGGIGALTAASDPDSQPDSRVRVTNSIIDAQCGTADIGSLVYGPGAGTGIQSITSEGGNLSSDSTCEPYFTEGSDQNNVGNLTSTLGSLSDNGGYVPTTPLLEGSPAVDSGVEVAGMTTDARLAARPQGNAFDSGAYESSFTRTTAGSSNENLASTGESTRNVVLMGALFAVLGIGGFVLSAKKHQSA